MSSPAIERRHNKRSAVMLSATVEQWSSAEGSKVLNVSAEGALVAGPELRAGASAVLRRNGIEIPGRVAWTDRDQSGIRFEKPLPVERLLRPIAPPRPFKVPDARRPGLKSVPLTPGERLLFSDWAEQRRD